MNSSPTGSSIPRALDEGADSFSRELVFAARNSQQPLPFRQACGVRGGKVVAHNAGGFFEGEWWVTKVVRL